MRRNRSFLFAALVGLTVVSGGTAACTALLGDYEVGPGSGGSEGGGAETGGDGDVAPDGALFDAGPDALPGDGGPPVPTGAFVSAMSFGSTQSSPPGNMRVAYGPDGSLFVLFAFGIPTTVLGKQLTPVGNFDIGLVKVGPDGAPRWVRSFGSPFSEAPGGLAVDAAGDVYISGSTEGDAMSFGGASRPLVRTSTRYLGWIAKLGGVLGEPLRAIGVDVPNGQGAQCQALAARGMRIAVLCNVFFGATFPMRPDATPRTIFPPGSGAATNAAPGIVVAELDPMLNAHWINGLGSEGMDFGSGIALAANDDLLFTAVASGVVSGGVAGGTFSDSETRTLALPVGPVTTTLVGRLTGAIGAGLWVKAFPGDNVNNVTLHGIAIDSMGRVVTTGSVNGAAMLGSKSVASSGAADLLTATFDGQTGGPLDAKVYGGAQLDEGRAVAVDRWDSVAVAGTYRSTTMLIDGKALPDPLPNATSGFVTRAAPNLATQWAAGFTTALQGTFLQSWSVATDPATGRVAAAGTFKGVINFGDGVPRSSDLNGTAYNVWVVQRAP